MENCSSPPTLATCAHAANGGFSRLLTFPKVRCRSLRIGAKVRNPTEGSGDVNGASDQAVISTTSPGLIKASAARTEGISGDKAAKRLLGAIKTTTAMPAD